MMFYIRKLKKLDKPTLLVLLGLMILGTVAVDEATSGTNLDGLYKYSIGFFVLFLLPMLLISLLDYSIFTGAAAYILYGIGLLCFSS